MFPIKINGKTEWITKIEDLKGLVSEDIYDVIIKLSEKKKHTFDEIEELKQDLENAALHISSLEGMIESDENDVRNKLDEFINELKFSLLSTEEIKIEDVIEKLIKIKKG